jgi:hypothetical protein
MPPSKEQDEWVERVLGFRTAPAASAPESLRASVAALSEKAAKLASAPRPTAPPRQQATNRLLASAAQKPAPDDPAEAHRHVAEFLPDFLVAVESERPATSQKLEAGAAVPPGDKMLGIADLFAAVQRSMAEWESLLDQAESADRQADTLEDEQEDRDEQEYDATLTTYNARRHDSIAAQDRAMKLMTELATKFNSLSETEQATAQQEARHA